MIVSPTFTFGIAVATLFGTLAHLILNGQGRHLLAYILAAWVGFGIGQAIGQVMNIRVLGIGDLNMLTAGIGALIAIITTMILSPRPQSAND